MDQFCSYDYVTLSKEKILCLVSKIRVLSYQCINIDLGVSWHEARANSNLPLCFSRSPSLSLLSWDSRDIENNKLREVGDNEEIFFHSKSQFRAKKNESLIGRVAIVTFFESGRNSTFPWIFVHPSTRLINSTKIVTILTISSKAMTPRFIGLPQNSTGFHKIFNEMKKTKIMC